METFTATSPASGESTGPFLPASDEQVQRAVERGRQAHERWRGVPLGERVALIAQVKNQIINSLEETVSAITRATGKPDLEALTSDILVCLDLMQYYEHNAEQILAPETRKGKNLYRLSRFEVSWLPLGVVAVISPWNHPLQLSLVPVLSALLAGNAVILKPSEITPSIGELIARLFEQAGAPDHLVQVIQGDGRVGQALIRSRPDKIFFTGSVTTGKAIMSAAAEHLIPVSLELGGKDPMIVFEDAPLHRAVQGALWGAFANAGQNCVATERLYIQRGIYEEFTGMLARAAKGLKVGTGREADMGPIINPAQLEIIEAHLDDALERGAGVLGERVHEGNWFHPLVLRDADHTMRVMKEETFGPLLPCMPFSTEDQAIQLANDSIYGLNASVWTADAARGRRVARQIVSGSCAINDVLKNIGNPATPFGGEKQSGFGRIHGPEGLRAFCRQHTLMTNRLALKREPNWFPYTGRTYQTVAAMIHAVFSDQGKATRTGRALRGLVDAYLKRE